jgi:hypothetical protein
MNVRFPYYLRRPPTAVRAARLDNIAIVPASVLVQKPQYKTIARQLPKKSVLLCSHSSPRQQAILERVASYFRSHGHQVTTLPLARILL